MHRVSSWCIDLCLLFLQLLIFLLQLVHLLLLLFLFLLLRSCLFLFLLALLFFPFVLILSSCIGLLLFNLSIQLSLLLDHLLFPFLFVNSYVFIGINCSVSHIFSRCLRHLSFVLVVFCLSLVCLSFPPLIVCFASFIVGLTILIINFFLNFLLFIFSNFLCFCFCLFFCNNFLELISLSKLYRFILMNANRAQTNRFTSKWESQKSD